MPDYGPFMDWDDLGITEGSRISFKNVGGELITETVTKIDRDKKTGEIRITCAAAPMPSGPLDDTSRWTVITSRFDTPQFLIASMRKMFRDTYGDELADAMEATIPPPYGTYTGPNPFGGADA
jgi:hypothetical protein